MTLNDLIYAKKSPQDIATATHATVATHTHPNVANVASVAVANSTDEKIMQIELELIKAWLIKIQEPESDHHLIINKCLSDPEALAYFLKHAQGGFLDE